MFSARGPSRRALLAAATLPLLPARAFGLDVGYPDRALTMYVGFSAGSATDVVGRIVGERLSRELKQPVVIENKIGAAGNLATETVVRAPPDGYSLLAVASAIATNPAVYSNLKFDTERDLSPIVMVGRVPIVLTVNSRVPARTLAEFIAYARSNPGRLTFGSSGFGGSTHLAAELLFSVCGIKLTHVPYRGNAPALQALIAGNIDVLIDNILGAVSSQNNPAVASLAISSKARSPLLPEVPTFAEAGVPDYDVSIFFGFLAPARLPKPVLDKLTSALLTAARDAEVGTRLRSIGMDVSPEGPVEFGALLHAELARWRKVAAEQNIRLAE